MTQNDGYVTLSSGPGHGTTFTLYLPVFVGREPIERRKAAPPPIQHALPAASTVLVVDDEPHVLAVAARSLDGAASDVLRASDGRRALEMLEGHGPPDLVLTDLMMPGMGGIELGRRLKERWPALPVLYMSGYSVEDLRREGVTGVERELLHKPFTPNSLVERVTATLSLAGGGHPPVGSRQRTSNVGAPHLEPEARQAGQAEQEPGRAAAERVTHALLALRHLAEVPFQKPLQLVEVGIRQRRDLHRRRVVVAPGRGGTHAHLVGEGQRRAQRVERGVPPLLHAAAHEREHRVLVEQRLVPEHHVPRRLPLEGVEPAAARAPDLHPVMQPHRQSRAQRRQPAPVAQKVLRADDRRPRSRRASSPPPAAP